MDELKDLSKNELVRECRRLRQLAGQMRTGESLEFEAIVNSDGVPKVNIRWDDIAAQVAPDDAQEMAISLLEVAEWARVDAAVFAAMLEMFDGNIQTAGGMMAILRKARNERADSSAKSVTSAGMRR